MRALLILTLAAAGCASNSDPPAATMTDHLRAAILSVRDGDLEQARTHLERHDHAHKSCWMWGWPHLVTGTFLEIAKHVFDGHDAAAEGCFDKALREYENAEFKIRSVRAYKDTFALLLPHVRERIGVMRDALLKQKAETPAHDEFGQEQSPY